MLGLDILRRIADKAAAPAMVTEGPPPPRAVTYECIGCAVYGVAPAGEPLVCWSCETDLTTVPR